MTHDEAIDAIISASSVSVLSYQEAIEGYLRLRGGPAQGMEARQGGDGTAPSQDDSPVGSSADAPKEV